MSAVQQWTITCDLCGVIAPVQGGDLDSTRRRLNREYCWIHAPNQDALTDVCGDCAPEVKL